MKIIIDKETNKARAVFEFNAELAGCLKEEKIEVWKVSDGTNSTTCSSEASALDVKKRLEDVAKAHEQTVEVTVEQTANFKRRCVADEEILAHIKREVMSGFQIALSSAKIVIPPVDSKDSSSSIE